MKVAIVGATGMVGSKMIQVLEERNFPVSQLIPSASQKSVGQILKYNNKEVKVESLECALEMSPDIALFSAGGGVSLEWAPKFAAKGTIVIDNSSAWRMHPDIKLIVPEVNGSQIESSDRIIANPNCSTIQLVVVLSALHRINPIKRVVVSTYQSITGTGVRAVEQMSNERKGIEAPGVYPYRIDQNLLPHIDIFLENGYTKEEQKIIDESKKIMSLPDLKITATTVRVPVMGGHSESVNIEFENEITPSLAREILQNAPGVKLYDDPSKLQYPMPIISEDTDEVWVGRIRQDESVENGLNMWIVADNLRKGAATNAVQIAEEWLRKEKNKLSN